MTRTYWQVVLYAGMVLTSFGCVTNATTEVTEAPFVATTDVTNGTTAGVADITGATSDFTSSTTPGAESAQNLVRAKQRLQKFTASSYDNVRADISRGSGEYLVSLATLAGVPSSQFPEFQSRMQDSYGTMFGDVIPAAESGRQIVDVAWAAGYGRRP
ncbi:MAG TPA: DUF3015 family protein [Nitrospira sp.]|nr:DUF3015 family protein [Nitrospira sp.]